MKFSDQSYNLRTELDLKNCELSPTELKRLERTLDPLRRPLEKFPVSTLYLTIEFSERSQQYRVRAALQLPGRALATRDVDEVAYPAVRRSIRKLVHSLIAYEHELGDTEDRVKHVKGTRQNVVPSQGVDSGTVEEAVRGGDYVAFRKLLFPYEEPLRKRIGRWIERYPSLEAQLNDRLTLADIVEEVFLTAFERFDDRPQAVPFGQWLEGLIDPSIKLLASATDEELTNISFAQSLWTEETR